MQRMMDCEPSAISEQSGTKPVRPLCLKSGRWSWILAALAAVSLTGAAPLSPAAAPTRQNAVLMAAPALRVACPGDCSGDLKVTVDELIVGVNIALGTTNPQVCSAMDRGGNGAVEVDELITAINATLDGCVLTAAGILRSEGKSSTQSAQILAGFGYECTDCGGALKVTFAADAWEAGADLKAAGYTCNDIKHAVEALFPGVDSDQVLTDIACEVEIVDPETPGYDQLGAGYDVFTAYADAEFVKNKILDLNRLNHDAKVLKFPVDKFSANQFQGTTIEGYVTSLSASAGLSGSYAFFSGSINSTMSQMSSVTTEWSFATVQIRHRVHGLSVLRMQPADLRGYLLPAFSDDINSNLDPAVLFDLYGTHLIGKLVVGGRLDYHLSALIRSEEQKRNIGVYAEAKFDSGFASLQLNTSFDYGAYRSQYVSNEDFSLASVGGQGQASKVWTDGDYTQWVDTVWQHPVFCDFGADPWLIPIWELADGGCAQGSRCWQIQEAYKVYAESKRITIPGASRDVLVDLAVTVDIPSTETGYQPLKNLDGSAQSAYVNKGVSSKRTPERQHDVIMEATKLWIAYKAVGEDQATGAPINGIHFYTGPGDLERELAYGTHHLLQMKVGGVDQAADLSYDTCEQATYWHHNPCPTSLCAYYCDEVGCNLSNTNLRQLHFTTVSDLLPNVPIQSLVLADRAAIITSNDFETRKRAIWWGPQDINRDGKVDDADAQLLLERVVWVRDIGGTEINLNEGAQNYHVYDYECPWGCCHVKTYIGDAPAQYLGYVGY